MLKTTKATFLLENEHIPVNPDQAPTGQSARAMALNMPFTLAPIRRPPTGMGPQAHPAYTLKDENKPGPESVVKRSWKVYNKNDKNNTEELR